MYSPAQRLQLRNWLVGAARHDPGVTAAALVGSAAREAEDEWSDIDLALRLAPGSEPATAADAWTERVRERAQVVDTLDIWTGPALYRVLLLSSTLQVDLSFWPADAFGPTGPAFRLIFGETAVAAPSVAAPLDQLRMGWLYALHVRSALARGRPWQAQQMLTGLRDQLVAAACLRHGLPSEQGRGVDDLPADVRAALATTLTGSLEPAALQDRFAASVELLVAELDLDGAGDSTGLTETLRRLVTTAPGAVPTGSAAAPTGTGSPDPRPRAQRRRDTEQRLRSDLDVWVGTASPQGVPYLVPLSFDWDGEALLLSTARASRTAQNVLATGAVRLGLGLTRDVVMVDGEVEVLEIDALPPEQGDRFARRTGFDPRDASTPYVWFRISPRRIQAWREVDELAGRELVRDGRWLV